VLPKWLCRVPPAPGSLGRLLAGLEVVKDLVHVLYGQVLVVVVVDLRGGKNSGFSFCNVLFNNMIFLVFIKNYIYPLVHTLPTTVAGVQAVPCYSDGLR
jgi:hypothetical protein